ncbi:MAG TPA: gluconate:H+ symporter [Verrucomicrobiae bacterium]|nr:gluconate:H+ symporter [Verrucomicrobiae bacterium]
MNPNSSLLLIALAAVVGLIVLIARFRLNAFIALLLASLFVGLCSGADLPAITKAILDGMGGVLGSIAAIIGLGTIVGKLLAESGGAEVVADTFMRLLGERRVHWTMMLIGFVVGIAVWFSVGLVLLIPIAYAIAKKSNVSLLLLGIPMVAGLSVMHGLVPPHPGPVAAIGMLDKAGAGADTGKIILYSLIVGFPTAVIAGPIFGRFIARRVPVEPGGIAADLVRERGSRERLPGFALTLFTILVPVMLMLLATVVDVALDELHQRQEWASANGHVWVSKAMSGLTTLRPWSAFLGTPIVAMLIATLFSFWSFGFARGFDRQRISKFSEECLGPVATVLLVVGAGGGFSKVLDVCQVGAAIAEMAKGMQLSPLLMGWLVAALIRIAVGSATVAISMAAGIVAPIAVAAPGTNLELLVIAMGAGSVILSHVNDGGFWFVKEYFNMTVPQTLKTWTVMETIISVVALMLTWILDQAV